MLLQEQFHEWCLAHPQSLPGSVSSISGVVTEQIRPARAWCDSTVARDAFVSSSWTIGGQSGGSCFNDGPHQYSGTSGEAEAEFTDLNDFLEEYYPTLSFIDYRKLLKLIEYVEFTDGRDFYGNYTTNMMKVLRLSDLDNILDAAGLLSYESVGYGYS